MKNDARMMGRCGALWLLIAACSYASSCTTTHNDDPSSSGSHWLTCRTDRDCSAKVAGTHCADDGVCVDASGDRVVDPDANHDAGSRADAGMGRAGSGGQGGGTDAGTLADSGPGDDYRPCAGKRCGEGCTLCAPDDSSCVETAEVKTCDAQGACVGGQVGCSIDAGIGVTLPDCFSFGASAGAMCSASGSDPVPECCSDGTHLRCEYDACTDSIPGSCFGAYQPVVGSKICGGYQPCAGKTCGDECTICEPGDTTCGETTVSKACDRTGTCAATTPDCTPPASCDPSDVGSCGAGQACCAVGRCGPIENGEGLCEPADPATGGCMRCACEDQPGGCPICNSPDTLIATPEGERAIAELHEGDLVLSMHHGRLEPVPVLATRNVRVFNHAVVRLQLDNGSTIEVSGSHPTADGQRLDALQPGDALGSVRVRAIELVPYEHDRTYDILPGSDSGTYLAGGALIGSTLFGR